jgi:hypothetical protein
MTDGEHHRHSDFVSANPGVTKLSAWSAGSERDGSRRQNWSGAVGGIPFMERIATGSAPPRAPPRTEERSTTVRPRNGGSRPTSRSATPVHPDGATGTSRCGRSSNRRGTSDAEAASGPTQTERPVIAVGPSSGSSSETTSPDARTGLPSIHSAVVRETAGRVAVLVERTLPGASANSRKMPQWRQWSLPMPHNFVSEIDL